MTTGETNHYIVAISVGPVGGFIGAGRRSRDLWYGSRLVSELTARVARYLHAAFGGNPHTDGRLELVVPPRSRIDINKKFLQSHEGPTISNRILARVRGATKDEVENALAKARQAAHDFLADEIDECASDSHFAEIVSSPIVRAQALAIRHGDFVEFFAAASKKWDGEADSEAENEAVEDVHEQIDTVKSIRSFLVPTSEPGVPKSSMNAGWDSALYETSDENEHKVLEFERERVGIRHEERLDAIGLLRRRAIFDAVDSELLTLPFPPLARVAAEPWIQGVARAAPQVFRRIALTLDRARRADARALMLVATPCREPGKQLDAIPTIFGYDPSLLFEGGIEALRRELENLVNGRRRLQALGNTPRNRMGTSSNLAVVNRAVGNAKGMLEQIKGDVSTLHQDFGVPSPYYALIEADGDGVGALLENAHGMHRMSFVQALYDFSDDAWKCVETHEGTAFYVGADELAAYLPLDKAFKAIASSVALFEKFVGASARGAGMSKENLPTVSVGMVVAHLKDDLRSVRRRAKKALKDAKNERRTKNQGGSFLRVVESVRGGSERCFSGPTTSLLEDMAHWQKLLENDRDLSLSMMHAWRGLIDRDFEEDSLLALVRADLMSRTKRSERTLDTTLHKRVEACASAPREKLEMLIHEILFASRLAGVEMQRNPQLSIKESA